MEQQHGSVASPTMTTQAVECPVCRRTVTLDQFARLICRCGWSGPGDPLEGTRGLTRFITGLDRRLANRLALRELRQVESGHIFYTLNAFYRLVLILYSTVIYLVILALVAGTIFLTVSSALSGGWLGVFLGLFLLGVLIYALQHGRTNASGIIATRDRFPDLFAALDEVCSRTASRLPQRVLLIPEGSFFVYERHPLRRLFFPERVLAIGVTSLSLMSAGEVKAIIAHELAHYRNLDTSLHRYYGVADHALAYILQVVREAMNDTNQKVRRAQRYRTGDPGAWAFIVLLPIYSLALLPVRIVWFGFRLLRLAESRKAEFLADRLAVHGYGAGPFIGALTTVSTTLLRQSRPQDHVVDDMRRLNTSNYYAAQRHHYNELPEEYRRRIDSEAMRDYPSLEHTHPTLSDRIIAARMTDPGMTAALEAPHSGTQLIIPKGESSADSIEVELSNLLMDRRASRRRR